MDFFKLLLAKEPEALMPKAPEEPTFHPRLSKLVEAASSRVKTSQDRLNDIIDEAIKDNVRIRTGKWEHGDDKE